MYSTRMCYPDEKTMYVIINQTGSVLSSSLTYQFNGFRKLLFDFPIRRFYHYRLLLARSKQEAQRATMAHLRASKYF